MVRQWVMGALFHRSRPTERLIFANLIKGQDLHRLWAACGQGAGFIKHQGIELASLPQCIGIAYQHTQFSRPADIGVASPRAHGQAMINTVVAITNVYPHGGYGPKKYQRVALINATTTAGTNIAEMRSASWPISGLLL